MGSAMGYADKTWTSTSGTYHWFKGSYFDSPAIIAQMPAGGNKDTDYFYASGESQIVGRSAHDSSHIIALCTVRHHTA